MISTDTPLIERHDLVMLDLDGVVYVGSHAVPGAVEALSETAAAGVRLAYITNNASRTPDAVAAHLRELGMPIADSSDVVTSAQAIARLMAEELPAGAKVLVVGGEGLREAIGSYGLVCCDTAEGVVALVQGYDASIGWSELAEASYAIQAGATWFASNLDLTIPTARGIAPGNGSLVEVVGRTTDQRPIVAGKPERPLFNETQIRYSAGCPIMVGDRPDTDIDGAISAGIASMLVLTGVCNLAGAIALDAGHRPDFVAADLHGLLGVHRPVTLGDASAQCGDARVVLTGERLEVSEGAPQSLDVLRAAVALGWATRDRGGNIASVDARLDP